MKIEKLPSGSYRVRKMYKGKMYSVVFDGKPTQKEALLAITDRLKNVQEKHTNRTFLDAGEQYIGKLKKVENLEMSTIRLGIWQEN